MTITINNKEINKIELVSLIYNGRKIEAIKLVKDKIGLSLKDCKTIVDNLEKNPHYYDGQSVDFKSTVENTTNTPNKKFYKSSHIIKTSTNYKNFIILFLLALSAILFYLLLSK